MSNDSKIDFFDLKEQYYVPSFKIRDSVSEKRTIN